MISADLPQSSFGLPHTTTPASTIYASNSINGKDHSAPRDSFSNIPVIRG